MKKYNTARRQRLALVGILAMAQALVACGGGGGSTATDPSQTPSGQPEGGSAAAATSVAVSPPSTQTYWGYSVQLTATARDAAGAVVAPAPGFVWQSSDTSTASVDGAGRVDLLRPGSASITAAVAGKTTVSATSAVNIRGLDGLARSADNTLCALAEGRQRIFCWGDGGTSTTAVIATPATSAVGHVQPTPIAPGDMPAGAAIARLSLALFSACAVTDAGQAYCWGDNSHGALGIGVRDNATTPRQVASGAVPAGVRLVDIANASDTACAAGDDGRLYCWGAQLVIPNPALSSTGYTYAPVSTAFGAVPGTVKLTRVALSTNTGCALGDDGEAYCWTSSSRTPVHIGQGDRPVGSRFVDLQLNSDLACGLASDGEAYCWSGGNGGSSGYRFGNGSAAFQTHPTPVRVAAGDRPVGVRLTSLSVGSNATASCASADDGQAYCWGKGYRGSLGDGIEAEHDALVPVRVLDGERPAGATWLGVNCATYTCSAMASDGRVYNWGANARGMLSREALTQSATPLRITRVLLP